MSDDHCASTFSSLGEAMTTATGNMGRLIEIDVAGECVRVPAALLAAADEGSVLAAMANGCHGAAHYVDCDPARFRAVLEYLRYGSAGVDRTSAAVLRHTALALGVDSLVRFCDEIGPETAAALSDDDRAYLRAELDRLALFIMSGEPERASTTCSFGSTETLDDAIRWAKVRHARIDALLHPQLYPRAMPPATYARGCADGTLGVGSVACALGLGLAVITVCGWLCAR
ncbi:BTB domain containing protein [Pandoravirus dulcis]|uniref:BTB domain containing protein n=1 Tax=Pandoravirus dulcis TaxID=1349409 RepID=S4VXN5_9VIRU|nr:BTB domain containing protein [Pandoravirus dulcis]AGO82831.2 BTB domain containing protein [Pandoravirus dulcis]